MGQRSQIYVRIQEGDKYHLITRYFGWNFAERMISRCRHTLEWISEYRDKGGQMFLPDNMEKLKRILDINFDMQDIVPSQDIIKEYHSLDFKKDYPDIKDYVFYGQDNNDGRLFIDVPEEGPLKYAFLDDDFHEDIIMDALNYMEWDCEDWKTSGCIDAKQKALCKDNIEEISRLAHLMTEEEIIEFVSCDYVSYYPEIPDEFWVSDLGMNVRECIEAIHFYMDHPDTDDRSLTCCQTKWEAYKEAIKHFFGIGCYLNKTEEFVGIASGQGEKQHWIYKIERKENK